MLVAGTAPIEAIVGVTDGWQALLDQMPQLPQIVAAMNGEETFMEGGEGFNGHRVLAYTPTVRWKNRCVPHEVNRHY